MTARDRSQDKDMQGYAPVSVCTLLVAFRSARSFKQTRADTSQHVQLAISERAVRSRALLFDVGNSRARLRLKNKLERLGFRSSDRDLLGRRAELFVPSLDRVGPRRKVLQFEAAVLTCHGKIRMLEDGHIPSHPRVEIALHRDSNLLLW